MTKTWNERCEDHPDHQTGMISSGMIQARMQEEIDDLRAALEQQAEPVALIRDGVLRWRIPHEHYSRPAWTAHGTHMLYAHGIGEKP